MNLPRLGGLVFALLAVPVATLADATVLRPFTTEALGDNNAMAPTKKAPRREPGSEGATGKAKRKVSASPAKQNSLKMAALSQASLGRHVFPLKPGGKTPLEKGGFHRATTDRAQIEKWWTKWPNANIGLWPGPSGLLVIDIDGEKGEASAARLGLLDEAPTLTVRTGREGGGRHLYFALPAQVEHVGNLFPAGKDGGIEVRGHAGYVAIPPSIHPSGRPYRFEDEAHPIRPLSERELGLLLHPASNNGNGKHPEPASPGTVPEGQRSNTLTTRIGRWLRLGLAEAEVRTLAHQYNLAHCRPPLPETEVDAIVRNITSLENAGVIEEFNRTYAVVQVSDRVRILQESEAGDFTLLPPTEFRTLHSNRTIHVGRKQVSAAELWLSSPKRRQFSRIVFEPGKLVTADGYNLWKKWTVEAGPGDCSMLLDHIRSNICAGDADLYRFVEGWLADLFQRPARKPETALVLRGRQGTGKSLLGKLVGRLLGRHYAPVASAHRVTGHFNAHLSGCLLLHCDEAFWAGDKAAEGALKDLVTNERMWIERKGVDAFEVPNYLRLLVTSNAHWVIPAGLEERRFATLDVAETRMQDRKYFGALVRQMEEANGYAALLDHLLRVDLAAVDVSRIPRTAALMEQKVASLPPEMAWLLDILTEGVLPGDSQGEGLAPTKILWDSYIAHAQKIGTRHRSIEVQVGGLLRKLFPEMRRVRKLGGGHERAYLYELPTLRKCRKAFEDVTGQRIGWPEDGGTWLRDDAAF